MNDAKIETLNKAVEAGQKYADSHPGDARFRELLSKYGQPHPRNRPYLRALSAYVRMADENRTKLLEWIEVMVRPSRRAWPRSSYALKHDAEARQGAYFRNDEFKAAMLVSGYGPTPDSVFDENWRFRIKPAVPSNRRPPHGSIARGLGGFGLHSKTFGKLVRANRQSVVLGLRQLARLAGISPGYLSKIERDLLAPPSEDVLRRIAQYLKLDPDDLVAQAGRVPTNLQEYIQATPHQMSRLIQAAGKLEPTEIDRLAAEAEEAYTVPSATGAAEVPGGTAA